MTHSQKVKRYNENDNEIVLPPKKTKQSMDEPSDPLTATPWSLLYANVLKEKVMDAELDELAELRRQNESLRAECETLKKTATPVHQTIRETSSLTDVPRDAEIAVIVSDEPIANVVLEHITTRLVSDDDASVEFVLNRVGSTYYACQKQSALLVDKIRRAVVSNVHKRIHSFKRGIKQVMSEDVKSEFDQTRVLVDTRVPETVINYLCARFPTINTVVDWVDYEDFKDAMCVPNVISHSTANRFDSITEKDSNITPAIAVKALRLAQDIYNGFHMEQVETDANGVFDANDQNTKMLRYGLFALSEDTSFILTNGIPSDFIAILSNYYQSNNARKVSSNSRRTSKNE